MNTDRAWQHYGRDNPYFGVLSHERYRRDNISAAALREFFDSGEAYVEQTLQACARHLRGTLPRAKALDFGCGVGRLTLALARRFESVAGIDVADAMLAEAQRNAAALGVHNVTFHRSLPSLAEQRGTFSFVNSYIVLQHVAAARGLQYVRDMLQLLAPEGYGAIHVTYGREKDRANDGVRTAVSRAAQQVSRPIAEWLRRVRGREPKMQMNPYPLNKLMFMLQDCGAHELHAQFTNHGGHLGLILLFAKGGADRPAPP